MREFVELTYPHDGVAVVTMSNPRIQNNGSWKAVHEIADAMIEARTQGQARAIVLASGVPGHWWEHAWLQDLAGLGCGAAIPALRTVEAMLAARPEAIVACVAVAICSAAFYLEEAPGVIVSACLFGDGAAATVWRRSPGPMNLRCHSFDTLHEPADRDRIRFEQRDGKLRNLLHPTVPDLAARAVALLHRQACNDGPPPARIVAHAGGKDVIAALERILPGYDLTPTRTILRRHGNMSSPSVLFALQEALREDAPTPEHDWWLTSFGAGFSAHSCRLSAG
jgi:alkylresorcinol/alkylpyrone synthase